MDEYVEYDITAASFEDFVTFIFDREYTPIPHDNKERGPWYWYAEVKFNSFRIAGFYNRLFTNPTFLVERYSLDQLEQAFWAVQSSNLSCAVSEIIWDSKIPFDIRANCVRSMEQLFGRLFVNNGLETAVEMWWDSLAYDWHCENRCRDKGGEDRQMQDVMFETLGKILEQPSPICQGSALHGLGHLHHPETEKLISSFLQRHSNIDENMRSYALAAAKFEVM